MLALVVHLDAYLSRSGGQRFDPCRVRQHSFVESDCEIFSTVILSLLLIQEGKLSVCGKRMATSTSYLLRRLSLLRKKCGLVN